MYLVGQVPLLIFNHVKGDPDASLTETPGVTPTPKVRPPPREKTDAEKWQALQVDCRCLVLSIAMLERVNTVSCSLLQSNLEP